LGDVFTRTAFDNNSPERLSRETSVAGRLEAIAELGAAAISAVRCAIAWSDAGVERVAHGGRDPSGSNLDEVIDAALSALATKIADSFAGKHVPNQDGGSAAIVALSDRDLRSLPGARATIDAGLQIVASAWPESGGALRVVAIAPADRARTELEVSLELVSTVGLAEIARGAAGQSVELWRTRAAESIREASLIKKNFEQENLDRCDLEKVLTNASGARLEERFQYLGESIAKYARFDTWIVTVCEDDELRVIASTHGLSGIDLRSMDSALALSFRKQAVVDRGNGRSRKFNEDSAFSCGYVCLGFEFGAIALGNSVDAPEGSVARAQQLIEKVAILVKSWLTEAALARSRALVNRLALRMFAAIDEERLKIARDLHDDQAQLLAAARIALEGDRDAARSIFKQVESELRRKTRALRPATLGKLALSMAIEREFERMQAAGLTAKLLAPGNLESISRPVQQLCFQIVREALSNVIRHARANQVEVTIEITVGAIRLTIRDDGHGVGANGDGVGLLGLKERIELMGGKLSVSFKAGGTIVSAEIPEPV